MISERSWVMWTAAFQIFCMISETLQGLPILTAPHSPSTSGAPTLHLQGCVWLPGEGAPAFISFVKEPTPL